MESSLRDRAGTGELPNEIEDAAGMDSPWELGFDSVCNVVVQS
jgi:hypothetical protein